MPNCLKNPIRSLKSHLMSMNMYETLKKKNSKAEYHFLHCSKVVISRFYGLKCLCLFAPLCLQFATNNV